MSKLDELIEMLCPDGVEYKKLGETAEILRGVRVTKALLSPNCDYPVISGGVKPLGYYDQYNRNANTITIAQYGTAGFIDWQWTRFWANDVCYSIVPKNSTNNRFLYYCLMNIQNEIYNLKTNAIPAHLPQEKLSLCLIPHPPLEIQQEIVCVLDKFTTMEAELEAELEARKKQYQYYLLKLFKSKSNWEKFSIGEVIDFQYGKGNTIPVGVGDYPVYGSNGIVGSTNEYNSENAPIIGHIGTAGTVNWGKGKHFVTYNGIICLAKKEKITPRFAYYVLVLQDFANKTKGSQPFISYEDVKKPIFFLPPIEEQARIVAVLDRFDILCNDLTSSLPAEIEARHKQYEYYRNKLLSFKEETNDAV